MWEALVLLFCGIITLNSSPITSYGPCKQDDHVCLTNMVRMMYKQSIMGDPSLNIQSLDPMYQEEIVGNLATINYKLMKTTIKGFGRCEIVNTTLSLEKNKLNLELVCPHFTLVGDYDIDGQLLGLVIQGNGDYFLESKDYYINIDTDIKVTQKSDGKKYMSIKTYKVTADCRGGTYFDLRNLFNGQKELGENVLKLMNQNWKSTAYELQGPVFNATIKKVIKNFNRYLQPQTLDTLIVLN